MQLTWQRYFAGALVIVFVVAFFTVPAEAAKRPWIGVYMQDVSRDLAEAFDLKSSKGVLVSSIEKNSPAEEAGLKARDVILEFDSKEVLDTEDMIDLVRESTIGEQIPVVINREGSEIALNIEIGERREPSFRSESNWGPDAFAFLDSYRRVGIGVSMQSLSGDLGEYFAVPDGEGALITEVMEDSPAEKAGLKVGDVIVGINGETVEGPGDVSSIMRGKDRGEEVELSIIRDRSSEKIALEVDEIETYGWDPQQSAPMPNVQVPNFNWDQFHNWNYRIPDIDTDRMQERMEKLQQNLEKMQLRLEELEQKVK
jgi:S1-C subfamily serine protease